MKYILFVLVLLSTSVQAEWLRTISDFTLTTANNEEFTLSAQSTTYSAIYIQGNGCPIARLSYPEYTRVRDQFASEDIVFIMLNANIQDSMERIIQEREEFAYDFDVIKDSMQSVAKQLGVERTAEVFVVKNATGEVVFRGPITDQLGYETQRLQATEHYLADAISTILQGGSVDHNSIPESKGCLVGIFL
jgi:hypothetical protein